MFTIIKSYILSVVVTAIVSSAVSMLTPARWARYVNVITGLIIVLCISQPVLYMLENDLFKDVELNANTIQTEGSQILQAEVKKELTSKIEADVRERLWEEFNLNVTATADISVSLADRIDGIKKITIYGDKPDPAAVGRLREVYGAGDIVYGGTEKNIKKTE